MWFKPLKKRASFFLESQFGLTTVHGLSFSSVFPALLPAGCIYFSLVDREKQVVCLTVGILMSNDLVSTCQDYRCKELITHSRTGLCTATPKDARGAHLAGSACEAQMKLVCVHTRGTLAGKKWIQANTELLPLLCF